MTGPLADKWETERSGATSAVPFVGPLADICYGSQAAVRHYARVFQQCLNKQTLHRRTAGLLVPIADLGTAAKSMASVTRAFRKTLDPACA